jgi:GNAT superfamily N-acetyltransferase
MDSPLRLRLLTENDLAFADSVRALAGWNQTPADWRRLLALEPNGCFLAEWNGTPVGTATTTTFGLDLAWIGMVLVHPEYRRRGVGKALLERCLEYLRAGGLRCIKLDATPVGKTVYDNLGFKSEWTLTRWANPNVAIGPAATAPGLRNWRAQDAGVLDRLDAAAFGVSRARLVQALAPQSHAAAIWESQPGLITGYGLVRPGARAFYLGPVVAELAKTALILVEALLTQCGGHPVFWDIPDPNTAAGEWARQHGFTPQRPLIRMYLCENRHPGDPQQQVALTGPETG